MSFKDLLGKQLIFADGAAGTHLQAAGLTPGEAPPNWNITHPDAVLSMHQAYLEAGATYITTNTFGANARKLTGTPYSAQEITTAGVHIARKAVAEYADTRFVALNLGPLGELLEPMGHLSFETAYELFAEQIEAGAAAGADFILIETMIDSYELKAAVLASREICELPIIATVAINEQGRLLNGADLRCVCALLEGLRVDALGLNCGAGPEDIHKYAKLLISMSSTPVVVCPNAGKPITKDGKIRYDTTPEQFAHQMKTLVEKGVAVTGGCCGTTPAHIAALVKVCGAKELTYSTKKPERYVCSYASCLTLDEAEHCIISHIDPASNKHLAQALLRGEYEYCIDDALEAQDDGAQIIGMSAIFPGVDEKQALPAMVKALQSVSKVPLLIAGSSLDAFEQALRIYNGCALVDLSRFAPEERNAATQIALRYGAVIKEH